MSSHLFLLRWHRNGPFKKMVVFSRRHWRRFQIPLHPQNPRSSRTSERVVSQLFNQLLNHKPPLFKGQRVFRIFHSILYNSLFVSRRWTKIFYRIFIKSWEKSIFLIKRVSVHFYDCVHKKESFLIDGKGTGKKPVNLWSVYINSC